ncbi:hypothetical protein [Massilia sp.]|nr:hypothetical protein [Massilia sp.]
MWILMLEAGVALFLLVFIVWWTMFSGRPEERKRPLREERSDPAKPDADA